MKILVMGTGAVGGYFGARLQQSGEQVVFCARGENLRALKQRGLEIESYQGDLRLEVAATDQPASLGPYDLVLFCVKTYDTEPAARALDGSLAPGGAVLTLQNGVENEDRLAAIFGPGAVMGGNAYIGAELVAPGRIVHAASGLIEFGELSGEVTERARRVADSFARAGVLAALTDDIRTTRWRKLLWNASFNTVTTLCRRHVGEVLDDPEGLALIRALMGEIVAVGRAEGARLGEADIEAHIARSMEHLRAVKTSTLQDLERGRRLEVEALTGALLRASRKHGIDVPVTAAIHALLKLLDARER